MSTITLVMYSSMSTITFLHTRVRVRVLKKYSYSSTSTQKVLVLEYEYKYTSTITPSLLEITNDFGLEQIVCEPMRINNTLDLFFTTKDLQ